MKKLQVLKPVVLHLHNIVDTVFIAKVFLFLKNQFWHSLYLVV